MATAFIKKNLALAPLAGVVVLGMGFAGAYLSRVAFSGHYLAWTSENSYPWQRIQPTQNTKLLCLQGDHKHEEVFKPRHPDDLRGRL